MICYAIKNELGQYLGITTNNNYEHFWTEIEYAYFFRDIDNYPAIRQAEDFIHTNYPKGNFKVVKVEIKEVEDEN